MPSRKENHSGDDIHPFAGLALMGQEYLEESLKKLTKEEYLVLNAEEAIKDIPADAPYTSYKGGWLFSIIKDGKLQDFLPHLQEIIERFYTRVLNYIENRQDKSNSVLLQSTIEKRKKLVLQAILEKIQDHEIYTLQKTYFNSDTNKKVTYDCSPLVEIELTWGNKTHITHIFKPTLDMNIIEGVGGSWGGGHDTYDIRISKDIFEGVNENSSHGNNYLANILGYKTKEELLDALQTGDHSKESKNQTYLGHNMEGTKEELN